MVVFDPVIDFYILEGHKNVANFVFVGYFAFMKVRVEVLNELREDSGRDSAWSEDRSSFMSLMKFDRCHVLYGGGGRSGRHCEIVVGRRI